MSNIDISVYFTLSTWLSLQIQWQNVGHIATLPENKYDIDNSFNKKAATLPEGQVDERGECCL